MNPKFKKTKTIKRFFTRAVDGSLWFSPLLLALSIARFHTLRTASLDDPVSALGSLRQFTVQWIFHVRPDLAEQEWLSCTKTSWMPKSENLCWR
jgi:hypothetical protein